MIERCEGVDGRRLCVSVDDRKLCGCVCMSMSVSLNGCVGVRECGCICELGMLEIYVRNCSFFGRVY